MNVSTKGNRGGLLVRGFLLAVALLVSAGAPVARPPDKVDLMRPGTETNAIVLAHQILNRWQPVAEASGAMTPIWREQYLAQLASMDVRTLHQLDRLDPQTGGAAKSRYDRFAAAFRSAVIQNVMLSAEGKGQLKFASVTIDQVFIPINPCRIVDTRNVGGPIAASTQRAFTWVRGTSAFSWSYQGGAPGPGATACPGTVFAYAGGTLPGSVADTRGYPSAAVATVTVVNPTAAGNLVVWGGAGAFPQSSALNFSAGQTIANTTVIPWGGRVSAGVEDFTVRYNGPSGQADVVVDVVGFFVQNTASTLECFSTIRQGNSVAANTTAGVGSSQCPSGYGLTGGGCYISGAGSLVESDYEAAPNAWACVARAGPAAMDVYSSARCCRLPGQ